ncbi:thiazolylpeptide-type bacteriocin [Actinomadura rudentiformis]|uniref:Thiazolylpeptide-type bacteriocin n=1 Tax=Actinomadura rudentiformis TaxID=359158 RepID=A0A6H9Y9B9_9ACTN|nr:thiazolylpeptide-type bacteriocin [Actinomadura rudentiformis]KAB2339987.1 thiazolylpeptide-type bacteriocin [Actinomadura rudentiformis]
MSDTDEDRGTHTVLQAELGLLEAETFEISDYVETIEEVAGTTSCTSTCSSCSSSSSTSCS